MALPEAVVAEARAWIGTPHVHGATRRGAGCDCLGLIRGVLAALGRPGPAHLPPYPSGWALRGRNEALRIGLALHLHELQPDQPAEPGQIALFRLRAGAPAGHLGILTQIAPVAAFVHAYDRHGVVESPLAAPWARRIVARFAID